MTKGEMINAIYEADLTKRATLVVFYLINRADKELTCFPGVKTIAKECNISPRTVRRALNDLAEAGFLKKESRFHEQGGQRSNLYTLLISEEMIAESDSNITFETYTEDNSEELEVVQNKDKSNRCFSDLNNKGKAYKKLSELIDIISRKIIRNKMLQQFCHGG